MPQPRSLTRTEAGRERSERGPTAPRGTLQFGQQEAAPAGGSRSQIPHLFLHSNSLRARARALIPDGASGRLAGDADYPLLSPGFITRGYGCRVIDADGHSYVEYGSGTCPVSLGHAHPAVVAAMEAALRSGDGFSRAPVLEPDAAEALIAILPSADMVRFFSSGSDALESAILLARAATGRTKILRVTTSDIGADTGCPNPLHPDVGDPLTALGCIETAGRMLAAIVIDASGEDEPAPSQLADLIKSAQQQGALAIFDERTTGFRWAEGGAQQAYGCTPDLSVFGSGATNGLPFAALAGRRPLMRLLPQLEHIAHHGVRAVPNRGASSLALAAMLAVIRTHQSEGATIAIHDIGRRLRDGARERVQYFGLAAQVGISGRVCRPLLKTCDLDGTPSPAFRALLLQETIRRGVLMTTLAPSLAHDDLAITTTLDAIDAALAVYARALSDGVNRHLIGHPGGTMAATRVGADRTGPAIGKGT